MAMGEVHIKPYAQGTPRLSDSDLAPRVLRLRPLELPLRVKVLADAHAEVEADACVRRVVGRHVVAAERAVEGRDLLDPFTPSMMAIRAGCHHAMDDGFLHGFRNVSRLE